MEHFPTQLVERQVAQLEGSSTVLVALADMARTGRHFFPGGFLETMDTAISSDKLLLLFFVSVSKRAQKI